MKRPMLFGKYCLLERISVGGMAEVFRAKPFHSPQPGRYLALKRILPHLAEDDEFINMFVDEARLTVQLNHPNIVRTYELGQFQSSSYILMEYINGKDVLALQKVLRRKRRIMNVAQACFLAREVAAGIEYVHSRRDASGQPLGIIHRDISPQNILITYSGRVKVIDFGIAKAAFQNTKTQVGVLKGKFGYMSPQQVRGAAIDHRSDVYSIGVVLWEVLTNRRLFRADNEYETLQMVRDPEVAPPSDFNSLVPPEVDRIVMKALAIDPDDRYQRAGDLADALTGYLRSLSTKYGAKHLSAWMTSTFADALREEREKGQIFADINTPEDVHEFLQSLDASGSSPRDMKQEGVWDAEVGDVGLDEAEAYGVEHTVVRAGGFDAELLGEQEDDVISLGLEDLIEVEELDGAGSFPRFDGPVAVAADQTEALSREEFAHLFDAPEEHTPVRRTEATPEIQEGEPAVPLQILGAALAVGLVLVLGGTAAYLAASNRAPQASPPPRVAAKAPATLVVQVTPPHRVEVLLNGEVRGTSSPLTLTGIPPGEHSLEVRRGQSVTRRLIQVKSGELRTVDVELRD